MTVDRKQQIAETKHILTISTKQIYLFVTNTCSGALTRGSRGTFGTGPGHFQGPEINVGIMLPDCCLCFSPTRPESFPNRHQIFPKKDRGQNYLNRKAKIRKHSD